MKYKILVIVMGLAFSSAWANCTASVGSVSRTSGSGGASVQYQGSDNADTITCANETKQASVDLGAGADTLIINDSPKLSVRGGDIPAFFGIDGDSYFFESNKVADNDRITLDRGSSAGNVYGDRYFQGTSNKGGRDTITIKAGSSVEFIAGDSFWNNASEGVGGDDTIIFDGGISLFVNNPFGAPVVGDEFLEGTGHTAGNDTIRILNQSTINGDILADMYKSSKPPTRPTVVAGNDTIIIDNSRVTKSIYGEAAGQGLLEPDKITDVAYTYRNRAGQITGNDRVELIGEKTEIGGNIKLYKGSDTVDYRGGKVIGEVDGGDDSSSADGYIDRFNVIGITQTVSNIGIKESQLRNFEEYALHSSQIDYENSHTTGTYEKYTIDKQSTATMTGGGGASYRINADNTVHDGVINLSDNQSGDIVTTSGNYTGSGRLLIDVDPSNNKADQLVVLGNTTGSKVTIVPTIATRAINQTYEVPIVMVTGDTATGQFSFPNNQTTFTQNNVIYTLLLANKVWLIRAAPTQQSAPAAVPSVTLGGLLVFSLFLIIAVRHRRTNLG